jgi:uncharacterized LabA/DUF88 family protein
MERVVIVMEYSNVNRAAADAGRTVNYAELLEYLVAGRFLVEAFCYVPIDPRNRHARDAEIEELRLQGWLVHTKVGRPEEQTYKCNFDVEITMEMMNIAQVIKPDTVILASGDIDFIPVVDELRRRGIRIEIAAFEAAMSRDLALHSSGCIELDQWLNEPRAADA